MDELSLIRAIARWSKPAGAPAPDLVAGIGDDCAILRPPRGADLLFTTDFVIEDVHFARQTSTGAAVGWKAMARGLSDIAAMGGDPRFALVSLALAAWTDQAYVKAIYHGLTRLARRYGVQIIGGDVTRTAKLTLDVVVIGSVPHGKALRRNGARSGDLVYVSGPLGRAAARNYVDRPEPRVELGRRLRGKASAAMDLSDGLAIDLHRLCVESQLAATLDGPLPTAPAATLEQALFGGEDYELLCTVPPEKKPPREFIRVGSITRGRPGRLTYAGLPLPPRGWDPFTPPEPEREP